MKQKTYKTLQEFNIEDQKTIPMFSFDGLETLCKIVKVIDGDTLKVVFWYNNALRKTNVRLLGIDTPENKRARPLEVSAGKVVASYVQKTCLGCIVHAAFGPNDKYGRPLCRIGIPKPPVPISRKTLQEDTNDLSKILVARRMAKAYEGSTKETWGDDDLNYILNLNK